MKTLGSINKLPDHLSVFIRKTCPWMDESWEPDSIGYWQIPWSRAAVVK